MLQMERYVIVLTQVDAVGMLFHRISCFPFELDVTLSLSDFRVFTLISILFMTRLRRLFPGSRKARKRRRQTSTAVGQVFVLPKSISLRNR
ncbi:MAG: hypothetical protein BJ554DRAFT_2116 [Olpidium bornovanus]|uniref:Uncharacterized protein n=1 Tax=Olpidium bornovanus TaxID=278681 RepID=A0A8H7ZRE4_9FUNG|nr:MAG: hypothetical protein BJ554DRAFT_2116 [Olpidium bornovanus]